MKTLAVLSLFALLWSGPVLATGARYSLSVDGLACPFCAYGIEKKLSAVDGVKEIETDVKSGRVVVTMQEGKELTEKRARAAVKDAGFSLHAFRRRADGG